ncbi:RNA polymerase sigma factor [Actinacidiphila alni]|uniref:RNA polymerase sigma factor n=1 Tax=Actinacidiphila alni TaxID=380248 RepID=UPI00345412C0
MAHDRPSVSLGSPRRIPTIRASLEHTAKEFPTDHISNPLIDSNDVIQQWEKKMELLDLVNGLPPRQRQVLTLSILGYSPLEIARELGITPEAARGNLLKARRHARLFFGLDEEDR